jgi:hypothetical protein
MPPSRLKGNTTATELGLPKRRDWDNFVDRAAVVEVPLDYLPENVNKFCLRQAALFIFILKKEAGDIPKGE